MKLQLRYNRITIISTLVVLALAAIGYYFLIRYVLIDQLDEALRVEEVEIHDYIARHNKLPEATIYKDQRIAFEKTDHISHRSFSSLTAFHPGENEMEPSRRLQFTVNVNGQIYMASVTKSEEATENLIWIILFSAVTLMVVLTAILFFTNRYLFKTLWKPFRSSLSAIKTFNVSEPVGIALQPTSIEEFRELNESILSMTEKVMKDYQSLKNFTDHASHEIQTPLAIINSKLDILIQQPELNESSMEQIQSIYHAVEKLSNLSQSLLLLTKIENNQYPGVSPIRLDQLIAETKTELTEWIDANGLQVTMQLKPLQTVMNYELAGILISNLFTNAIRHTSAGGQLRITTTGNTLMIENSGSSPLDHNKVFARFHKSPGSGGSGLGLAIVKQICDQYRFHLTYLFEESMHLFMIKFAL